MTSFSFPQTWGTGALFLVTLQLMGASGVALVLALGRSSLPRAPARGTLTMAAILGLVLSFASAYLYEAGRGTSAVSAHATRLPASKPGPRVAGGSGLTASGEALMKRGEYAQAAAAYRQAIADGLDTARAHLALGEALVFAANNTVTAPAREAFLRALERDPANPGARYYLAVYSFQQKDYRTSLMRFEAIKRDSKPGDPWMPLIAEGISRSAQMLKGAKAPGAGAPSSTGRQAAEIMKLPPAERQAMINGMVTRLAARLAENPKDLEGWLRLGRAYRVLGRGDDARKAYRSALQHFPEQGPRIRPLLRALTDK